MFDYNDFDESDNRFVEENIVNPRQYSREEAWGGIVITRISLLLYDQYLYNQILLQIHETDAR